MRSNNFTDYITQDEFFRLRKQVKLLTLACSVLAIVVCAQFLVGFAKSSQQTVPDVVTAKRFVVVDSTGQTIATLGPRSNTTIPYTELVIYSPDVRDYISLASGLKDVQFNMSAWEKVDTNRKMSRVTINVADVGGIYSDFGSEFPSNPAHFLPHVFLSTGPAGAQVMTCGNTSADMSHCPKLQQ